MPKPLRPVVIIALGLLVVCVGVGFRPVEPPPDPGVLDEVWNHVNERFFDLEFNGVDWQAVGDRYRTRAQAAQTRPEHAAKLVRHHIARGRVYTAKELTNLTSLLRMGVSNNEFRGIAQLKLAFGVTIVDIDDAPDNGPLEPFVRVPVERCPSCHENRFWRSIYGNVICGYCHPPSSAVVAEWLDSRPRVTND